MSQDAAAAPFARRDEREETRREPKRARGSVTFRADYPAKTASFFPSPEKHAISVRLSVWLPPFDPRRATGPLPTAHTSAHSTYGTRVHAGHGKSLIKTNHLVTSFPVRLSFSRSLSPHTHSPNGKRLSPLPPSPLLVGRNSRASLTTQWRVRGKCSVSAAAAARACCQPDRLCARVGEKGFTALTVCSLATK